MAGNQGRPDPQRFRLVIGECCLGFIKTNHSPKQIVMLWEFWRDELAGPDSDEQFIDWIKGYAQPCESGNNLELPL